MTKEKAKVFFEEVIGPMANSMTIVCSHKGVNMTFGELGVPEEAGEAISLHTVQAREFCTENNLEIPEDTFRQAEELAAMRK